MARASSPTQPSPRAAMAAWSGISSRLSVTAWRMIRSITREACASSRPSRRSVLSRAARTISSRHAPSIRTTSRMISASMPAGIYPRGCPWVIAATLAPCHTAASSGQSSYRRPKGPTKPTGAARITPPQPLLWLMGSPRVPILPDRRLPRQVLPGARRANISGMRSSRLRSCQAPFAG